MLRCSGRSNVSNRVGQLLRYLLTALLVFVFAPQLETLKKAPKPEGEKARIPPPPHWLNKISIMCVIWCYLFIIVWIFHRGMSSICRRWPVIAKALLIAKRDAGEDLWQLDEIAWTGFCFILGILAVCVLWYAFMYEEKGTANPSWTDVFG